MNYKGINKPFSIKRYNDICKLSITITSTYIALGSIHKENITHGKSMYTTEVL